MSSWNVRAEPAPCMGLVRLAWAGHLLAALAPWVAGCSPTLAAALSVTGLLALRSTLAALPGGRCVLRTLRCQEGAWSVAMSDGRWVPAQVGGATRVFAGLVVVRLLTEGRRYDWWLPGYAIPADEFRRLKVAMRCIRHG